MNNKNYKTLVFLLLISLFTSCNQADEISPETDTSTDIISEVELETPNELDTDYNWDDSGATNIILKGEVVEITGEGASFEENIITISKAGTYNVSGILSDGMLEVDSDDQENVNIILNAASIYNSGSSAISILNAEKVVISLKAGTENNLEDAIQYTADDEKNGTIYSKADLIFTGEGTLNVTANFQDGIVSKDGLIINSGNYIIHAEDDAIRGKDYLLIHNGSFDLQAGGDGLASDNDEDSSRGYVTIEEGQFAISTGADGIQAVTVLQIQNGEFEISSGGGSSRTVSSNSSAKALKAGVLLKISDGHINIDAADDAIHSNQNIIIDGGAILLNSADDGIHADEALEINSGEITISKSYEGLESKLITINDGLLKITSSDDGINATDGTSTGFGGGMNRGEANSFFYMNGGFVSVNASGDGLDANGSIVMSGGTVLVNGPTQSMNGALDYDHSFSISGGLLVAVGSSRMAQSPDGNSEQESVLLNLGQTVKAGTILEITDTAGNELLCFSSAKNYETVAFSSPDLKSGTTYEIYLGGSHSGVLSEGLYAEGVYSGGQLLGEFKL
ncbi:carbohydrate-binding domain-containing protein [Jiulongibacter sp. NS-SX5]|uniref:carbohydrate-binding domain-containing protein n=1 Tax=Jiulongibacter sp. NS-SX5 TaxID=3463854 RepID=UPI00405915D0